MGSKSVTKRELLGKLKSNDNIKSLQRMGVIKNRREGGVVMVTVVVFLLSTLLGSGSGGSFITSSSSTSTNSIRGRSGSSSGYGYVQLSSSNNFPRRRETRRDTSGAESHSSSSSSSSSSSVGNNVTLLVEEIGRNCQAYCKDVTQNNGLCVNKGCKEWKTGLRDGCSFLCNGSEANYGESYSCQLGCSRAVKEYYRRVTELTGVPEPPTLISGSLKSSSLRLSWEGTSLPLPFLAFAVQKRLFGRASASWETLPSQTPLNATSFAVHGLRPYTEYQFRVGWILAHDFPPFYSVESNRIETIPKGLPNAPEITSIQHISNTSVAVTWLPPTQPNGRIVAYILKLQKVPNGHAIIKEIPITENLRGYTFSGLDPVTNYSLAISAQVLEGEGDAANVHFVTPQSSMSNEVSKRPEPRLLVQGARDVYLQNLDLFSEPDVPVFTSTHVVSAIGAHFGYKWVFVATTDGEIFRSNLDRNETVTLIPRDRLELSEVAFLSVDWLHNKLYIVGKKRRSAAWVIKRSDLTGDKLITLYSYLNTKPIDFAADPFTGYIYWVTPRVSTFRGGLYKLDIMPNGDSLGTPRPQSVLEGEGLGPFTIDVTNYRILIVHKSRNTVLAVSLDGDVSDIRRNTQSPQFSDVKSLATYNGLFFWTTGRSVVMEEYNAAQDSFYHNSWDVPKGQQPIGRVVVVTPDLQPTPVPLAPPQHVQVIYAESRARVSWRPPPPISGLGEGAWLEWKYQIRVSDNRSVSNITTTEFIIHDLRPSTFYTVQVLAYTAGGKGPFSSPKRGKTLRETASDITLLWGSQNGLYSTNTLGENVQLLTTSPSLKVEPYMWSLTWYESSVFFALSNGSVFYYDARDPKPLKDPVTSVARVPKVSMVRGITYAQSIAFDYIGQRLYWSNPKQQTILRCPFTTDGVGGSNGGGGSYERLQLVTMAREIAVDSFKGFLLWSTGHSLEMSRLNGYFHGTLYQTGLFSGVQIMGITLDTDQSRIYWITRSSSGSTLQRLSYNIRGAQLPMVIANYDDVTITGPIRYFNDRLLWLQGESEAVITDLYGQGKSSLTIGTIRNITNVHVKDQASLRYPGGLSKHRVQVNPDPVMKWSVVIGGKWNNFTIQWQPVNNTNYGKVLYEVVVNNSISRITSHANITLENSTMFQPYNPIEVSITSLTYWASAKATISTLRTPSWRPTEPVNPRIFLEYPSNSHTNSFRGDESVIQVSKIRGILRWDAPSSPNGPLLGYLVHCWKDSTKKPDCQCQLDPSGQSCELENLDPLSSYEFAVQAYTDAGAGILSRKVRADTAFDNPLPRLLVTSKDSLEILDIDRNSLKKIPLGGYMSPASAAYLYEENTVFWLNDGSDLFMSNFNSSESNKTRLLTLQDDTAGLLTLDWIGRKLFWTSSSPGEPTKYSIMTYDLSSPLSKASAKAILNSTTPIKAIAVNPFSKTLFWTTTRRNGLTTLFASDLEGNLIRPFLSKDHDHCSCSNYTLPGEPLSFDPTGYGPLARGLLFVDKSSSILLADEHGCNCIPLVENLTGGVNKITGDKGHLYWTSGGVIKASTKGRMGGSVTNLLEHEVRELAAFGETIQPFPDLNCLIPREMDPGEPLLFNHSSHSLVLRLPGAKAVNCTGPKPSLPTNKYEVYYGTVDENGISKCTPTSPSFCKVMSTLESLLHISDLHPFTTYTVFVTLTNFYAQRERLEPLVCAPIMLRTAPGAPMPPKLLRLEPLTPSAVRVVWGRPEKLNGEKVWYEVNWKTTGPAGETLRNTAAANNAKYSGQKWAVTETRSNANRTEFHFDLLDILPSTNYTIWVSAYSEKGDAFSPSVAKTVKTFNSPRNLTLIQATPHNLTLEWKPPNDTSILRHQFKYRDGWSSQWNFTQLVDFTIPGRPYRFTIGSLKPKTLYGFRIRSWYIGDPGTEFLWPVEGQWNFETLADKPGRPTTPIAKGIGKAKYEISWEKAEENGAAIELYSLEYRVHPAFSQDNETNSSSVSSSSMIQPGLNESLVKLHERQRRDTEVAEKLILATETTVAKRINLQPIWILVYNGSETRWEVDRLDIDSNYVFRVRAKNVYGWGEYSEESGFVNLAALTLVAEPQGIGVIVGTIFLAFTVLGLFGILFVLLYREKHKEKPSLGLGPSERREVELATLRELPGGSGFVHQSNILYAGGDLILDLDLAGIPKISWTQITVTKFLGSGAFGEVYEGIAGNLMENDGPDGTRVAIKALKKGANQNEKIEFIQEAKLMTQFRHPHIIQLLGICVDTDPCCLLLELMSGGDLLSYLRSNRPSLGASNPSGERPLTLVDLLRMCVDVAKGCVCLEEMHFVHRDIAARNCLVQLQDAHLGLGRRVVKIGDFGLARDIYRNDYYRKEGEGLLPVRWMAPESLVDGVFTTQTDVWAFGVLLWEIMTLGQQPYPARNNVEVWNYVRGGGRLQRPVHCPDVLGNMMTQCWEYEPEKRPSFKRCLQELEMIARDFEDNGVIEGLPPLNHFDPYSYSDGGSDTKSTHTSYTRGDYPNSSQFVSPPLGLPHHHTLPSSHSHHSHPNRFPKYLEVLSDSSTTNDHTTFLDEGYEIPLPLKPPRNPIPHPQHPPTTSSTTPRHYWNTNPTAPLQYRNLLASSTSEDADIEEEEDLSPPSHHGEKSSSHCPIPSHHFLQNVGGRCLGTATHLRGVPCTSVTNYAYTSKDYKNHVYAANSLQNNSLTNNNNYSPGDEAFLEGDEDEEGESEEEMRVTSYAPIQLQVSLSSTNGGRGASPNNGGVGGGGGGNASGNSSSSNNNNYIRQSYVPTSLNSLA